MAIREVNLNETASRLLEIKREVLMRLAEASALVEVAEAEMAEARRRREEILPDFTEAEAAELLKISYETLQREREKFAFPHIKHGTRYYYTAEHIRVIREMRTQNKATLTKWRKFRNADES